MTPLARPGGVVALQEPDSAAWAIDPPHPGSELLRTELFDLYPRSVRDFHTVRRAVRLLCVAGQPRSVSSPGSPCPASTSSKLDSTMTELGERLRKTLPVGHLAGLGKKAMRLAAEPAREPSRNRIARSACIPHRCRRTAEADRSAVLGSWQAWARRRRRTR
jgi:hypothetical protein